MSRQSAYVVLGIGVTKSTFFVPHSSSFECCDECGTPVRKKSIERATPDFAAWGHRRGYNNPDELWAALTSDGFVKDPPQKLPMDLSLRIWNVGPLESNANPSGFLALGFRLVERQGEQLWTQQHPDDPSLDELKVKGDYLMAVASELGIENLLPVRLYLTFFWSI